MAFDESKHPRGDKGSPKGGKFVDVGDYSKHSQIGDTVRINKRMQGGGKVGEIVDKPSSAGFVVVRGNKGLNGIYHESDLEYHRDTEAAYQHMKSKETAGQTLVNQTKITTRAENKVALQKRIKDNYEKRTGRKLSMEPLDFDAVLSLSRDDADAVATKDPLVWWKEVAHVGTFHKGDRRVKISEQLLDHWARTHVEMSRDGIEVPCPVEHTRDPEKRRGTVLKLARRNNSRGIPALYAKIRFNDEETARQLSKSGVSAFSPSRSQSGLTGKVFRSPLEHVCFTDYPVIPALEPFTQAIALSLASEVAAAPARQEGKTLLLNKLKTNFERRTGRKFAESDEIALSRVVLDAAARHGDIDTADITLAFPPEKKDGAAPVAPAAPGQPQPAAPTLRGVADQLGIDPAVTDDAQLLAMVMQAVVQMKARVAVQQPVAPPQPQFAQRPMVTHQGAAPARPPVAMSLERILNSLDEDDVMALSKKQFKKLKKSVALAARGPETPDERARATRRPDPTPADETDDDELGLSLDDELGLSLDDDADRAMPASLLNTVKGARQTVIDSLFQQGVVSGAGKKNLEERYVRGEAVALSHVHDDGFDAMVKQLRLNGPVLKTRSSTGPQAPTGSVALSHNAGDPNPVLAEAERRAAEAARG